MLRALAPDHLVAHLSQIDSAWLSRRRIRGLLVDLDGTLLADRETSCEARTIAWLRSLRESRIAACVVSNSGPARVGPIVRALDAALPFVCRARKPLTGGLLRGLGRIGLRVEEAALVGDQVFTDVLGGKCLGIRTILVWPPERDGRQQNNGENWVTRMKRPLERIVLGR
jgi:HAD superfamily phosphatase (TIGR01668 family)